MEVRELLPRIRRAVRFSAKIYPLYGKMSRVERKVFLTTGLLKRMAGMIPMVDIHLLDNRTILIEESVPYVANEVGYLLLSTLCLNVLLGVSEEEILMRTDTWPQVESEEGLILSPIFGSSLMSMKEILLRSFATLSPCDLGRPFYRAKCAHMAKAMLINAVSMAGTFGISPKNFTEFAMSAVFKSTE